MRTLSPEKKIKMYIELNDIRGINDVLNTGVDINSLYHDKNFIYYSIQQMNLNLIHFFHDKGCNILIKFSNCDNPFIAIKKFIKKAEEDHKLIMYKENKESDYNIIKQWINDSNTQIRLINAQTDVLYVLNDLGMLNKDVIEKYQHLLTAKEINIL